MKFGYNEILPIYAHRREIIEAIEQNEVVVVVGETGSGKSTQIPKMLLEALIEIEKVDPATGELKIAHTQPRRIAATSIAMRVAEEMEVKLSEEVGYKIRFDDESTRGTIITVCTDGILLQEMKGDNLLSRYNAILVDEAHERNLNIDFLLGLLKNIHLERKKAGLKPLKIVVTSATVDATKFVNFFAELNEQGKIPVVNVSGRLFPVDLKYVPLAYGENVFYRVADLVKTLLRQGSEGQALTLQGGDMLIFMPGEAEIFSTIRAIEYLNLKKIRCVPLYSRLSMSDQQLIYKDYPGETKIVVATNIAETSLTVPGIKYVIDSGLARITDFNFRTGIGSLEVKPISQSAAVQRAGRAGRVQAGECYRLFSKDDFENRPKYTVPEIQRSDLASVVLHMILIGIRDVYNFDFIDPPDQKAFSGAFKTLHELGAVSKQNLLTELGLKMAHLPLEPKISAMLLAAEKYNVVREIAVIASSLSVKDPFLRPKEDEEEADQAKSYFQRLARGEATHKTIKLRKGRKIITKRVATKSAESALSWTSDLLVFLVVWNKLRELLTEEEKARFCERNYLNLLMLNEIEQIYHQLIETLHIFAGAEFEKYLNQPGEKLVMNLAKREGIVKAIATGLIQNLLEFDGRVSYRSKNSEHIFIHPGSALFGYTPHWVVSAEIVETTKFYARNNTVVDPAWFEEIAPQLCDYRYGKIGYDRVEGRVVTEEDVFFRGHKIIKGRVREMREDDREGAQCGQGEVLRMFIREALVKGQALYQYPFLKDNKKVLDEVYRFYQKSGDKKLDINDEKLIEWYLERFLSKKVKCCSIDALNQYLEKYGDQFLRMKTDDFLSLTDREKIDRYSPDFIYLLGKKLEVRYFKNHFRFPDGPAISLVFDDLVKLDQEKYLQAIGKYSGFKPTLLLCTDNVFSSPVAEGNSIDQLKEEYDEWHLRKYWKIARKKYQKVGVRLIEVWPLLSHILAKVEVGDSLFFGKGELSKVYGWLGLSHDGKKFAMLLFANEAEALKVSKESLRRILMEKAGTDFYFSEEEIEKLEEKYARFFQGMDMKDRLNELLWQKIGFEENFKDAESLRDVGGVKKILEKKIAELPEMKLFVLKWLNGKLDYLTKLNQRIKNLDDFEMIDLKEEIERGKID